MPEEDRVFDVSRPGRGTPQATSKPVIIGHRPTINDPMMKDETTAETPAAAATRISVQDDSSREPIAATSSAIEPNEALQSSWNGQLSSDSSSSSFNESLAPALGAVAAGPEAAEETPSPESNNSFQPLPESLAPLPEQTPQPAIEPLARVEELHVSSPKPKKPWLFILLFLLVLIIAAYLAIDSGLIKTSVKLPFHVFKHKAAPAVSTPQPQAAPLTNVPAGFTVYKVSGTSITFAAPTAWGEPTSTTDPGYTTRTEGSKSDGAHAYIIDFAVNKDIQVAVTSSKYLPAARAVQYYDFLNWCTGTSDKKTYLSVLQFTTADKADKATTVSCNQGPITDATKLNSTTIVEPNTKGTDGTVFGDLYTKNLADNEFVVFRVKDKIMKNSTQIKQLLNTIKASSTASSSSSSQ